jgi:hypothetical protein
MKNLLLIFFVFASGLILSQEEESALPNNPSLFGKENKPLKKNEGTFDSTFIFEVDTLRLPLFDDFSTNKFQKYQANYGDPDVSSDKKFAVLNMSDISFPDGTVFSLDSTYKRTIDTTNNTITDDYFVFQTVKYNNLSGYPVSYQTLNAYPSYILIDTVDFPNPVDTLYITDNIISQDSATQFIKTIAEPGKYWLEERAYHNYRFAVEPWTIGVATFDGLDENGYPYSFGTGAADYADFLTTKAIDLSSVALSDSVYLSFLYQKQGFGNAPEPGDSLVLEFFNSASNEWDRKWATNGGLVEDFKFAHIPINNTDYLAKNFQIRFKNFGSIAGDIDHFNLDYFILRQFSSHNDTLFKDFAFVYPITSLLNDYISVPWDHYKNNPNGKMSSQVEIVVRNGSNIPENNQNGTVIVEHNNITEHTYTMNAQTLSGGNINYGPRTTYYSYHDFSAGYKFDETKTGTKQEFEITASATAQFTDSTVNDTSKFTQFFSNYYAYDDGTAERAYGINGQQARLAVRYDAYEADSLIGISTHFVPSVNDVSNKLFILTVWDNDNGQPGNILYQDNLFFPRQPFYETARNKFFNYFFDDTIKVKVDPTFFIGWRQFDADELNIGIDKNNDNSSENFYSLDGEASWINSSIPGSLMIRPIFSTSLDAELGIEEKFVDKDEILVYPNPTSGVIRVKSQSGNEINGLEVFSYLGKKVAQSYTNTVDLSSFEPGVYLVKTLDSNGNETLFRVVKQ